MPNPGSQNLGDELHKRAKKRAANRGSEIVVFYIMTPGKEYTAKDIWKILNSTSVGLSLSTVYKALNKLCNNKSVVKVRHGVYVRPK
jgi:Fe2+ or Zn2+ uptake regulation protein